MRLQARVTHQVKVPFYTNATAYDLQYSGGLTGNGTGVGKASKEARCGGCGS